MSSITRELAAVLRAVQRPGDFVTAGTMESPPPRLEVDGVGVIAFPFLQVQAEPLIAAAERAPYGRGEQTLVDTQVRRTWQIAADRVRIGGKHWPRTLEAILAVVAEGLGVDKEITAALYKLLIYDQGSFFVNHRDTEKVPGMFGTLVVVLPSESTGGELVVRHKDREVRLDLRCDDPAEVRFAAFYADCVHEVLPVTAGCRLVLVYNLVRGGKGSRLEPPSYDSEQVRVAALLQAWAAAERSPDDSAPEKLIYPLEHAYTPAELGFDTLKSVDAAVAGVLAAAAARAECDVHTALLSVVESGFAEYSGHTRGRGRWAEPELEAGDVEDRLATLSEWRRPDGGRPELGTLPFEETELCPPDVFEDIDPDDEEFEEATGNEGASFERTYSRAALVLWPRRRLFVVLAQAGLEVTLPYLANLVERWAAAVEGEKSSLWNEAHTLASHMLSQWPKYWYPGHNGKPSAGTRLLTSLARLGDTAHIEAFLAETIVRGRFETKDNDAIRAALAALPPDQAVSLIQRTISGAAASALGPCGDLLAGMVAALPSDRIAGLAGAAAALVQALPGGEPRQAPDGLPLRRDNGVSAGFVADLFNATVPVDETVAGRAADHILSYPKTYGCDAVLVPAVRQLAGTARINGSAAVRRLRDACVEHLRARAAEPLESPKDWRRTSDIDCKCANCAELRRFLGHPAEKRWIFKGGEIVRRHVEGTIRNARCDLDVMTEKQGRPYSLVCTKNQASHEQRA